MLEIRICQNGHIVKSAPAAITLTTAKIETGLDKLLIRAMASHCPAGPLTKVLTPFRRADVKHGDCFAVARNDKPENKKARPCGRAFYQALDN
jgi:hypothetical protein